VSSSQQTLVTNHENGGHGVTKTQRKALLAAEPERDVASMGRPAARADDRDRIEPKRERLIGRVSLALRFDSGLARPEGTPIDAAAASTLS
jgi:hypothetical protein